MAYIKRAEYTVRDNDSIKEEMLDTLYENDSITERKARQLVYYPVPMSLIRWGKYLTPAQITRFLVSVDDLNDNGSKIDETNDEISEDNLGI